MPNPVKRHSKSRRNSRRAHDAIKAPAGAVCPQCNEPKMPHRACSSCGTYKGREVVNLDKGE